MTTTAAQPKPLRWLTEFLAHRPQGDRNYVLLWATMKALEDGHDREEVVPAMYHAARESGLEDRESKRTIRSALDRFDAKQPPDEPYTDTDEPRLDYSKHPLAPEWDWITARIKEGVPYKEAQAEWDEAHFDQPAWDWATEDNPEPEPDSGILHIDVYRTTIPSEIDWVAKNFVYRGGVTLLTGPPKGGKSTLVAAQLQWARENNAEFLGETVKQGPCLLITEEGGIAVIYKMPDIHNAYIYDRRAAAGESFDATLAKAGDWFAEHDDGLIIIDTLAIWANIEDENDAAKTTAAVAKVMLLAQTANAPIIVVHHTRKSGGSHGEAIRGSGAILATVDISLELKRTSDKATDDRWLDIIGRVLLPMRLVLSFDRQTRHYTKEDAAEFEDSEIEGFLEGVPMTGEGVSREWLASHWKIKEPRKRIEKLLNKGRMREQKEDLPTGGTKFLYWAIPSAHVTPHFEEEDDDE